MGAKTMGQTGERNHEVWFFVVFVSLRFCFGSMFGLSILGCVLLRWYMLFDSSHGYRPSLLQISRLTLLMVIYVL